MSFSLKTALDFDEITYKGREYGVNKYGDVIDAHYRYIGNFDSKSMTITKKGYNEPPYIMIERMRLIERKNPKTFEDIMIDGKEYYMNVLEYVISPEGKWMGKYNSHTNTIEKAPKPEELDELLKDEYESENEPEKEYTMEQLRNWDILKLMGREFGVNERGDVINDRGEYIGRWDKKGFHTSVPKPANWDKIME